MKANWVVLPYPLQLYQPYEFKERLKRRKRHLDRPLWKQRVTKLLEVWKLKAKQLPLLVR